MSKSLATAAMQAIDPALAVGFGELARCLKVEPALAVKIKSQEAGSATYYQKLAKRYAKGRLSKSPKPPSTVADDFTGLVMQHYFAIPAAELPRIQQTHALSMAAENIVGDLLERYIASCLEPSGWVWCSGSTMRSVDFIKPPANARGKWTLLQVKNRDNSENSSSSAIRTDTNIQHWHRSFSRKTGSNWAAFPDELLRCQLSEEGFKTFAVTTLKGLRP